MGSDIPQPEKDSTLKTLKLLVSLQLVGGGVRHPAPPTHPSCTHGPAHEELPQLVCPEELQRARGPCREERGQWPGQSCLFHNLIVHFGQLTLLSWASVSLSFPNRLSGLGSP